MKIESVSIDGNIISFNPGLNVLIGRNGCGKTRVFDQIKSDIYDDDRYDIGFYTDHKKHYVFMNLIKFLEEESPKKDIFLAFLQKGFPDIVDIYIKDGHNIVICE